MVDRERGSERVRGRESCQEQSVARFMERVAREGQSTAVSFVEADY